MADKKLTKAQIMEAVESMSVLELSELGSMTFENFGLPRPKLEYYGSTTFENFDLQRPKLAHDQRKSLETAYKIALGYAKNPDGWLIFQGEYGCGKTHLAASIANERPHKDDS